MMIHFKFRFVLRCSDLIMYLEGTHGLSYIIHIFVRIHIIHIIITHLSIHIENDIHIVIIVFIILH